MRMVSSDVDFVRANRREQIPTLLDGSIVSISASGIDRIEAAVELARSMNLPAATIDVKDLSA
jgi:hypothetical protein